MYAINIDAGGTMTDGVVLGDQTAITVKVDSTPHDLTVAMFELLSQVASRLNYENLTSLLRDVEVIRWSSTVASNVLAEQSGSKVGLLVNSANGKNLYAESPSPALDSVIEPANVIQIDENLEDKPILDAVRALLEDGVRRICVSFSDAFARGEAERRVKSIVNRQYPDHCMGAVPVLMGHEMAQSRDDMTRAHYALINAYVHSPLAASLFKAEDRLKYEQDWKGTFLVGHTNGGMARIGKTKAIDTIESGPVFGTFAGAHFARHYGLQHVLCLDVGGTTAKCSIVDDGQHVQKRGGDLFGIPVETPLQLLRSVALGGGSIVRPSPDSPYKVQVGPESMGSSPGPACYGLGGDDATLTDCLVILGYIDPEGFLGGRRELDLRRARQAIERDVGGPLGISVEEASLLVRDRAAETLKTLAEKTAREADISASEATVFAYGGNGPLLAPFVAEQMGINHLVVSFSFGPTFSAFGTAITNIVHVYEQGIVNSGKDTAAELNQVISTLRERGARDLQSEGFDVGAASMRAELEIDDGDTVPLSIDSTNSDFPEFSDALVRLYAEHPLASLKVPSLEEGGASPEATEISRRQVRFTDQPTEVPVFDHRGLRAGNRITGPAIICGGDLTCIVPTGWELTVDSFGNGIMKR